ncbi:DUF4440 domain-containing protein [Scytonema hofmannii PCC 7110]|uniref:DUF4440 domain-containing protein n=1 Tax=Scytonema hofmannii PCC 7110 TaxID=128403 RepID=A0A139XDC8_9CYAN|nr:nuclear transport factor 2 family protein [Scytonema hofmannii]KYC42711.1 DUF4440 domain-containing protein [Scytonema hofmannii PCC 7110]
MVLLSFVLSMVGSASQNRTRQNVRTLIEQARNAWVARDPDAVAQLFTSDGELIVPGQRWQGQTKIRQEVSKFAEQFIDVSITIRRVVVDGNQAAVEWHYEDTEKRTGKRNKADDAIVLEVKDGRIVYWREYFDNETLAKQDRE